MSPLCEDPRAAELLLLLWKAPDRDAGIAVVNLPEAMQDEALLTACEGAQLIRFARRNHSWMGAGANRKLELATGWNVAELAKPNRKQVWKVLTESLGEDVPDEIRLRVQLAYLGSSEASRLALELRAFTLLDKYPETAAGHLEFIEWVYLEVREQANALREEKYSHESIAKQLKRGVKWYEARVRLDSLAVNSGISAGAVEQVARVLRHDLTVGAVEQIADLLGPAVKALRESLESSRDVGSIPKTLPTTSTVAKAERPRYSYPFHYRPPMLSPLEFEQRDKAIEAERRAEAEYRAELLRIGVNPFSDFIPSGDPREAELSTARQRLHGAVADARKSGPPFFVPDPSELLLTEIDSTIVTARVIQGDRDSDHDAQAIESFDSRIAELCAECGWQLPPFPVEQSKRMALMRRRSWLAERLEALAHDADAIGERAVVGRIPHALATAHQELMAELDKGIQQYKANQRFSNSIAVCRHIERFVDALNQLTGGNGELRRRATLIETRCGPGSEYDVAREKALPSYKGQPRKLTGSNLAIGRLRKSFGTPLFQAEVTAERIDIELVLSERILRLNPASREAFESWRGACRDVQREGQLLEVDGCWYLLNLHDAGEDKPSDRAKGAKIITQSRLGGANLEAIKGAAESLFNWACNISTTNVSASHAQLLEAPSWVNGSGNEFKGFRHGFSDNKNRIFIDDVDNFARVRDVKPEMVSHLLDGPYLDLSEDEVQIGLEQILVVPFHRKDWGGEFCDMYTANVVVKGIRRATAFLLKGPGIGKKEMTLAHCGTNGDQILRLFMLPAEVFIIQYVGPIAELLVADAQGKIEHLAAKGRNAQLLIMDGQDTARLLHAYGIL